MIKKTVLVVEDDAPIREAFRSILELEGYHVVEAENGKEALDYLHSGQLPHLILLDLMMPVMDGVEFHLRRIENPQWAQVPAIVVSAGGNLKEKLAKMGDNLPVLKKPTDLDTIIETVQRYVA